MHKRPFWLDFILTSVGVITIGLILNLTMLICNQVLGPMVENIPEKAVGVVMLLFICLGATLYYRDTPHSLS